MSILSFQSRVVYGHVGNSAAEFALRRLGMDVWPVDTVLLSHHPGHGPSRGRCSSSAEINDLVAGIIEIGLLPQCDAVLSGYLGSADNGRAVLAAVAQVKAVRPGAIFCCDPVIGDRDAGVYVDAAQVSFFRDTAAAAADILTPNHFELELLSEMALPTLADVLAAADRLRTGGPKIILISSLIVPDLPAATLGTLLVSDDGAWLVVTPRLSLRARGAGDLLAALFLARLLQAHDPLAALTAAVASTFAVIERTGAAAELRLVAAQHVLAEPQRTFPAALLRQSEPPVLRHSG